MRLFPLAFIFPFFFLPVLTNAQDGTISFGFSLSPERSSPSTFLYQFEDPILDGFQLVENAKTSFSAGVVTQYWMNDYLSLRLGVEYSDKGYKQILISDLDGSLNITRYRFAYLSLPLTAKMPLNAGPSFGYLTSGVSVDIFLHGYGGYRNFFNDTFSQVATSFILGIGVESRLDEKFNFAFEPTFRLAMSDYSEVRAYRPFSIGLALRLIYR